MMGATVTAMWAGTGRGSRLNCKNNQLVPRNLNQMRLFFRNLNLSATGSEQADCDFKFAS
jgi:hypothetical protein